MKFEINSDPANLKFVRQKVRQAISEFQFSGCDVDILILAIDESVQNIIRYAYNMDKQKKINFEILKENQNLIFKIRDFGKQVPLDQIQSRDLKDVKPGGLGVHFIKSIAKEVKYTHQNDEFGGTEIFLKF